MRAVGWIAAITKASPGGTLVWNNDDAGYATDPAASVVAIGYTVTALRNWPGGGDSNTGTYRYTEAPPYVPVVPTGPTAPTQPDPEPIVAQLSPALLEMRGIFQGQRTPTYNAETSIPMDSVTWDLPEWFVAGGLPYEHTWLGANANPSEWGLTMTAEVAASYPDPHDVVIGSDQRWLPLAGSYAGNTWTAHVGAPALELHAGYGDGVALDTTTPYVRGSDLHTNGAVVLQAEDYLWTDDIDFDDSAITVAIVAVLRQPSHTFSGVLTTGAPTGVYSKTGAYLDLRYTSDGRLITQYNTHLGSRITKTGLVRAGQPVVVGFSWRKSLRLLDTFVMDRSVVHSLNMLDQGLDGAARLFVGNSLAAAEDDVYADMDILEINYWSGAMFSIKPRPKKVPRGWSRYDMTPLNKMLTRLNRIYGITKS